MRKLKRRMKSDTAQDVCLVLPEAALTAVFDECDRFDQDETGGRVIGTLAQHHGRLTLQVAGIIEAGPAAQRTSVSFFQDGAYQEGVFREIEQRHPEIEHLGNWHTHHVNGLSTLSGGDIATYNRIVNHPNHNTDFFYALLVTGKNRTTDPRRRYSVKHYLFRRGDTGFYEIPPSQVEITDAPILWPPDAQRSARNGQPESADLRARPERVYDRDIIAEFYRGFRAFASKKLGLYWRGILELLDDSSIEIIVLEDSAASTPTYSVAVRNPPEELARAAEELGQQRFESARGALITTERTCNRALYRHRADTRDIHAHVGG